MEPSPYLREQLITYLGNKRRLLGFVEQGLSACLQRLGRREVRIADLFAGSGVVSRMFKGHAAALVVNDIEPYAEVVAHCYLANRGELDLARIVDTVERIESLKRRTDLGRGFIQRLYSPEDDARIQKGERAFYTSANAAILDNIRRMIGQEPTAVQPFLLGPLLSQASIHANTSGVFKGFYKDARTGVGKFGGTAENALGRILGEIVLQVPVFSEHECAVTVHRADANELVRRMDAVDIAYLDPPYNQHPYGSNYFMLNLLTTYKAPEAGRMSRVSGIPKDWNRSAYNVARRALPSFVELVQHVPARMLLVSYSNEGFIPFDDMRAALEAVGTTSVLEADYSAFKGSRNLRGRPLRVTERLFVVEKR